jgi:hypothetical protein
MAVLDRAAILGAKDLVAEPLEVPQWGGTVYLRPLSGTQRGQLEYRSDYRRTGNPEKNYSMLRALLCSLVLSDQQGSLLFTEADIDALNEKSAAALDLIFDTAQRKNGITKKDVEALTKNSNASPSVEHGSGSAQS